MLKDQRYRRTAECSKWSKILEERHDKIPVYDAEVLKGSSVSALAVAKNGFDSPLIVHDPPSTFGMRIPQMQSLSEVSDIIGGDHPVKLIDVGSQTQIEGHTLREFATFLSGYSSTAHKTLNMITLEFSSTPLSAKVAAPERSRGDYPSVQKYCLSGMAGSYTDFHVDFGGTSVWYHVLSGRKRFLFAPPTLQFLGDLLQSRAADGKPQLFRLDLLPGQTLIIPGAWIHAVYTPEDSLVVGGNFLTSSKIIRQLQVAQVEQQTRVGKQFRFPYYKEINFYTLCHLLPLAQMALSAAQTAGSISSIDYESLLEDEDDDMVTAVNQLVTETSVRRQYPYLVRVCEGWLEGGTQTVARNDALRLTSIGKTAIQDYKAQGRCGSIKEVRDICHEWWVLLEQMAVLRSDAEEQVHIQRIRNCHKDCIDFLNASFVCGGLRGSCNEWEEEALREISLTDAYQFGSANANSQDTLSPQSSSKSPERFSESPEHLIGAPTLVETQWVQCAACLKWRVLADGIDPSNLPEDWVCQDNTWDAKYKACSVPEEQETAAESDLVSAPVPVQQEAPPVEKLTFSLGALRRAKEQQFNDRDEDSNIKTEEGSSSGIPEGGQKRKLHLTLAPKAKKLPEQDSYKVQYEPLVATTTAGTDAGRTRGKKLSRSFLEEITDVEVNDDGSEAENGPEFVDGAAADEYEAPEVDVAEEDFEVSSESSGDGISSGSDNEYAEDEGLDDDGMQILHVDGALDESPSEPRAKRRRVSTSKVVPSKLPHAPAPVNGVFNVAKFTGPSSAEAAPISSSQAGMPSLASLVGAATMSSQRSIQPMSSANRAVPVAAPASRGIGSSSGMSSAKSVGQVSAHQRQPPSRAQLMKLLNKKR
eukprot:GSChrysophyteH1.ASY1.ANO1.1759.1 assembled CDS